MVYFLKIQNSRNNFFFDEPLTAPATAKAVLYCRYSIFSHKHELFGRSYTISPSCKVAQLS